MKVLFRMPYIMVSRALWRGRCPHIAGIRPLSAGSPRRHTLLLTNCRKAQIIHPCFVTKQTCGSVLFLSKSNHSHFMNEKVVNVLVLICVCLLPLRARTAEQISMKFGIWVAYTLD